MDIEVNTQRCTLCGRPPSGLMSVSLPGELTCAEHPTIGRCVFCAWPHADADPSGWRGFGASRLRCPTCLVDAVETQQAARTRLPAIRADMAAIGVRLPVRVLVRLVAPDELGHSAQTAAGQMVLGVTEHLSSGGRPPEVVEIRIARGQPPLQFGWSVAHEIGHAWITQHSERRPELSVEEGFCELFAHAWLKRQQGRVSEELRRRLRENPDPIYGEGFRTVHAAARRHGVVAVMESLTRQGRLPV